MTSKAQILSAVRHTPLPLRELPPHAGPWLTFADRAGQFATSLASVGGVCLAARDVAAIRAALETLPQFTAAKKVCSPLPELGVGNVSLPDVATPHDLEDVDVAIVPGEFAVAENGAVWVNARGLKHRAILFLVQHLVLVVRGDAVVNTMHEAYARLEFAEPGFGVFISGPSKTADIEQSLVIGAHGPRSHTVFLLEAAP